MRRYRFTHHAPNRSGAIAAVCVTVPLFVWLGVAATAVDIGIRLRRRGGRAANRRQGCADEQPAPAPAHAGCRGEANHVPVVIDDTDDLDTGAVDPLEAYGTLAWDEVDPTREHRSFADRLAGLPAGRYHFRRNNG